MSKLLFRLNQVEDDEAGEVRALLNEAGIEFYETNAGRWRISVAAIWLRYDDDYDQARTLLNEYQQQRSERIQQEYRQLEEKGEHETFWQRAQERPADLILAILAVAVVVGIMVWPFLNFAGK